MFKFTIYLTDKHGKHVLLTDGAWTAVSNCYLERDMRDFGYYLNKPRLFDRKRDAIKCAREQYNSAHDSRITVERWDRAASSRAGVQS